MKEICCFALLLSICSSSFAQNDDKMSLQQSMYIFPEFVQGTVHFKDGSDQAASLNYNSFFQEMIFQQNGRMMAVDNTSAIDTVYLRNSKFIPVDTMFYEVRKANGSATYYVLHGCKVSREEVNTNSAYSGKSVTGAVQTIDLGIFRLSAASPYDLKLPVAYRVTHSQLFFVKNEKRMLPLNNMRQMKKALPGHNEVLKTFLKSNDIDFSNEGDIQKLLVFYSNL